MTGSTRDIVATNLWHRKLGHMSEKGMKILLFNGKLLGLKSPKFGFCES